MKSYSVTFGYTQYLVLHSMNDPEGKKTTIRRYLHTHLETSLSCVFMHVCKAKSAEVREFS